MISRRRHRTQCLRRCDRGATAVEFAFIAPVMIALILGTIETGRALFTMTSISRALAETTRWAYTAIEADATAGTEDDVQQYLIAAASGVAVTPGQITVTYNGGSSCSGSEIVIRVRHPYGMMFADIVPFGAITFDQTLASPLQCWP